MSLRRVAEKANVSVMTVSRVLNGTGRVSEETRHRVLGITRALGVFPKHRRGPLPKEGQHSEKRTERTVGILIASSDLSSTFLSELILAIQRALGQQEFDCVIQSFSGEYADFVRAVRGVRAHTAVGCLTVGHFSANEVLAVIAASPNCVFVDYTPVPDLDAPINVVTYDNAAAAKIAARQLIACRCRRIVCLQGMPFNHFSRTMRQGFLAALDRNDFEHGQLLTADFTALGGYEAIRKALADGVEFDGLFTTDEMAFGAMRALKEAGREIPGDVKIMGCDGMALGKELTPPLSTVMLDRQELGQRAVQRLMALIHSDHVTYEQILLPPRLEIRGSCVPESGSA